MAFEILIVCLVSPLQTFFGLIRSVLIDVSQVLCVFVCFIILLVQIKPQWGDVFYGYVPSSVSPHMSHMSRLYARN
jgi:metal iron transporter